MSVISDAGISPALLQAISHTLTKTASTDVTSAKATLSLKMESTNSKSAEDASQRFVSSMISGVNEPLALVQEHQIKGEVVESEGEGDENDNEMGMPTASSEDIKQMLKIKIGAGGMVASSSGLPLDILSASALSNSNGNQTGFGGLSVSTETDINKLASVLTTMATQHLQGGENEPKEVDNEEVKPVPSVVEEDDVEANEQTEQPKQVIICYQQGADTVTPQVQNVIMSVTENTEQPVEVVTSSGSHVTGQVIGTTAAGQFISTGGQIIFQPTGGSGEGDSTDMQPKYVRIESGSGEFVTDSQGGEVQHIEIHSGSNVTVMSSDMQQYTGTPCPVCGDIISGYHYGIFTCESCKGFFKRTVQNKKTFVCHRKGECEINLENRKKCPACRFAKCLVMGMKLEAIRADRTRGGRSSYDGASPQATHQKLSAEKRVRPRPARRMESGSSSQDGAPGNSQLVAILNNNGSHPPSSTDKPFVPQILTDIMNLESLLCDDDLLADIADEKLTENDPNLLLSILQLAEYKLYKVVRWARNLPQFASISTDDQILLLQNSWCELLTFCCCWKSIHRNDDLLLHSNKTINESKAKTLGIVDIYQRIQELVAHLKRLMIDQYEFVGMKVLILLSPDMRDLKDKEKLAEHQERICEAVQQYTSSHYIRLPNKFGEMMIRLPELARISMLVKDHLLKWMPANSSSCGLLFELLKGENLKDVG